MKISLLICFIGIASCNITGTFPLAILYGVDAMDQLPSFSLCKTEIGHLIGLPAQTLDLFKLGEYVHAATYFSEAVAKLVNHCGKLSGELKQYSNEIKQIVQQPDFKQKAQSRVLKNWPIFLKDMIAVDQFIKSGNKYMAGFKVGEMISIILYDENTQQ